MDMQAPPQPAGQAPAAAQGDQAGRYCIEIYVNPDGTFEVSKVVKPQEVAAPAGEPGQAADNIGDALKLVLELYEQDGNAQAEDEFDQGFGASKAQAPAAAAKPAMQPQRY